MHYCNSNQHFPAGLSSFLGGAFMSDIGHWEPEAELEPSAEQLRGSSSFAAGAAPFCPVSPSPGPASPSPSPGLVFAASAAPHSGPTLIAVDLYGPEHNKGYNFTLHTRIFVVWKPEAIRGIYLGETVRAWDLLQNLLPDREYKRGITHLKLCRSWTKAWASWARGGPTDIPQCFHL